MRLTIDELREIYEAAVKAFGHPDPLGYMTRAILLSEADPDYIDLDNKQGFMPVESSRAVEMTGASEVQSLEANLMATLTMDKMLYEQYEGDLDKMVIAFTYGEIGDVYTAEQRAFLEEIAEEREVVIDCFTLDWPQLVTWLNY